MSDRIRTSLWVCVFGAVIAVYLIGAARALSTNTDPDADDTTPYLSTALTIRETGGPAGFLKALVRGEYTEANQHPLYMALLAPVAQRDIRFFVRAKIITAVIGVLVIASVLIILAVLFNRYVALYAGLFLALNRYFLDASSMVACESLLVFCLLWMWFFFARACDRERTFLLAGIFCGLAYLTKGSGALFLGSCALTAAILWRARACTHMALCWFLGGFVVSSAFLLVRNAVVYGEPFYNINGSVMWMDHWDQYFSIEFRESHGKAFTLWSYLERNGFGALLRRFVWGINNQWRLFSSVAGAPIPGGLERFGGIVMTVLFALGLAFERWQRALFIVMSASMYFAFFSWYAAITSHARFMLPLIPFVYAYAVYGVWRLTQLLIARKRLLHALWLIPLVLCAGAVAVQARAQSPFRDPWQSYYLRPGYAPLMSWYHHNALESVTLFGPTHAYPAFYDARLAQAKPFTFMPPDLTWEGFTAFLKGGAFEFVIVDSQMVRRRPLLQTVCDRREDGSLYAKELPSGWTVAFSDPSPVCDYIVFHLTHGSDELRS